MNPPKGTTIQPIPDSLTPKPRRNPNGLAPAQAPAASPECCANGTEITDSLKEFQSLCHRDP